MDAVVLDDDGGDGSHKKRRLELWNEKVAGQFDVDDAMLNFKQVGNLQYAQSKAVEKMKKSDINVKGVTTRGKKCQKKVAVLRNLASTVRDDAWDVKSRLVIEKKRFYNKSKNQQKYLKELKEWFEEEPVSKVVEKVDREVQ